MDLRSVGSKVLEVENLGLVINDVEILKDISFSIYEGQIVLLKGASGTGKSSILNVITRIIPQSLDGDVRGKVKILGEDINNCEICDLAGKIGFLMQDPDGQLCTFNVEDEILFGMENLNFTKGYMKEKLEEIIDFFSLNDIREKSLNELSLGQKQRVAFASIAAIDPELYILDEPTANLDPNSALEIIEIIKKLTKEHGKSVLIIEHNLKILSKYVDFVYDLDNKKFSENTGDIIEKYIEENRLPEISHKPAQENVMNVRNINFNYGKDKVLHDISFDLKKGEILAIVGHNGAGKSTLANILSGLRRVFDGEVIVNSKNIKNMSLKEIGKTVGLVFQNPEHQFIKNTVKDELAIGLKTRGENGEKIDKKVDYYLDLFKLSDKRYLSPFQLSQGEKRKLSTADMLITDQMILILDEPTYGQDRDNLTNLLGLLYKVSKSGVGIIMITHDEEIIKKGCHKVLELKKGRINYYGDSKEYALKR